MQLRLTSPEVFDRLIDYLEKEYNLVWPYLRDYLIETIKKRMKNDTVIVDVDWRYNTRTNRVESIARYSVLSEIETDEEYLKQQLSADEDEQERDKG